MAGFSDFMERWILDTLFTTGGPGATIPNDQIYVALCYGDPEGQLPFSQEVPETINGRDTGYVRQRVYFTVTQDVTGLTVAKNTHFSDAGNGGAKTPGGVDFPIALCDWSRPITHVALYDSEDMVGSTCYFSAPLTNPKNLTIGDQFRIRVNDLLITLD